MNVNHPLEVLEMNVSIDLCSHSFAPTTVLYIHLEIEEVDKLPSLGRNLQSTKREEHMGCTSKKVC